MKKQIVTIVLGAAIMLGTASTLFAQTSGVAVGAALQVEADIVRCSTMGLPLRGLRVDLHLRCAEWWLSAPG
jgi:hypothetical protein